ncbi:siderophore iron transporter Arn1p [Monosporozyma unispora]|nr:ferrioxamine B transporter [Kazachstania unispora]
MSLNSEHMVKQPHDVESLSVHNDSLSIDESIKSEKQEPIFLQNTVTDTDEKSGVNQSGTTQYSDIKGIRSAQLYAKHYSHPFYRVALFFSIFLVAYAYGLDGMVRYTYQATATSSYAQHSLLSTVNCIRSVIAAAGQIWFARASDIGGRFPLLVIAVVFYSMGTIIESQATTVSKFAAGACFYQLGYTGIVLLLEVIAADFSNLNYRLLASFVPALPFIINTWISGNITTAVGTRWKWGIGMWAFILPLSCIPLGICLLHMRWLAHRDEETKKQLDQVENEWKIPRSWNQFWDVYVMDLFIWKLDFIGLFLSCVTFGCILVPFTLAGGLQRQWRTAHIIVPEVIGWVIALPLYIIWETKFARMPLTPWDLIKDRGILFALIIAFFINFIWYMQGDYMYTVLVVSVNETIKSATRITSLYSFVSVITGTILGVFIIKFRRTKPFIMFGASMWFLSFGLLVHFRGDTNSHSGIIGSLCLLGFGAGFFTYTTQASIQASAKTHEKLAVITALYLATYNIGSALGGAISGAIWTQVLPREISKRLKNETLSADAYGSPFTFIYQYPWGSPERVSVTQAYKHVQKILCIVGLCFCVPLLLCTFMLRNYRLADSVTLDEDEKEHGNYTTDGKYAEDDGYDSDTATMKQRFVRMFQ